MAKKDKSVEITLEQVLTECGMNVEFDSHKPTNANSVGVYDSVLHIAVMNGNLKHVKILVENGAGVNFKGDMGYTPLHNAILARHRNIIDYLLSVGSDKNIKNEFGISSREMARDYGIKI
jgi:ankyrin repeat protein